MPLDLSTPSSTLPRLRPPRAWLGGLPLHARFALVGSVVSFFGMLIVGTQVADKIETSVVRNSAISSAVYMESVVAPLSQELAASQKLRPDTIERLRDVLDRPPLSDRVVSVKIWRAGGLVAFSSDPDLIGETLEPTENLRRAWKGELTASFDDLDDDENAPERSTGMPLLEVYNPIHSIVTGEIIAVAEFYLDVPELKSDLWGANISTWAVVALVTAATFAALFGIVRSGSRTIDQQNRELTERLSELARLYDQNEALRERVQSASLRASETNERYLRRLSAELHDGPAQALALASLRLDSLKHRAPLPPDDVEMAELRATLSDAMGDIRDLCRGLTLPNLEGRSILATIRLAIEAHERRTGGTVHLACDEVLGQEGRAPHPVLICVYRFVQEGLMNAFRHAGGLGQSVLCGRNGRWLMLAVSDTGPGFAPEDLAGDGLGLAGLRERVESMGGDFHIDSAPGEGTRIRASIPLEERT